MPSSDFGGAPGPVRRRQDVASGIALTPLYRRLSELGAWSRLGTVVRMGPRGRSGEFTTQDPDGLLRDLMATGRFCTDTKAGRVLHPGAISVRERSSTESLHVALYGRGQRVTVHLSIGGLRLPSAATSQVLAVTRCPWWPPTLPDASGRNSRAGSWAGGSGLTLNVPLRGSSDSRLTAIRGAQRVIPRTVPNLRVDGAGDHGKPPLSITENHQFGEAPGGSSVMLSHGVRHHLLVRRG